MVCFFVYPLCNSFVVKTPKRMVKFTYSNSQRLHSSLISKLIQSLINPFILFGLFIIFILISYREICLELNNQFSLGNYLSDNSNLSVISMNLSTENNNIDLGSIINSEKEYFLNNTSVYFQNNINSTNNFLSQQYQEIIEIFDTTLSLKLNDTKTLVKEQTTIKSLLDSLNNTIIEALAQDETKIGNVKSQLENAVFVGDTVDTSNLTLNYDDIQQSLESAINSQGNIYDNSTLLSLSDSSSDFIAEIEELFETAISNIKELETSIELNSTSYEINLVPNLTSTNISSTNGTTNSSTISESQISHFKTESNNNLIISGTFLIVAYIFIMIYQYFKFRYQLSYTTSTLVDLEKSETKLDYIGIIQKTNEPTVTMMTSIQSQLFKINQAERGFWINSFLFGESSNLPYLCMFGFMFLILMLSLSKLKWDTSVSGSESSNYSILKQYNLTQFQTIDIIDLNDLAIEFVEQYNSQIQDNFQNISTSLQEIYDNYNITDILSLDPISLNYTNITAPTFKSSITTTSLINQIQSLQFEIKSNINISSIKLSHFLTITFQTIITTTITLTKLFLILNSIIFLLIIALGIIYSFCI